MKGSEGERGEGRVEGGETEGEVTVVVVVVEVEVEVEVKVEKERKGNDRIEKVQSIYHRMGYSHVSRNKRRFLLCGGGGRSSSSHGRSGSGGGSGVGSGIGIGSIGRIRSSVSLRIDRRRRR